GFIYDSDWVVEVNLKPGVTDATGETTLQAIRVLEVKGVVSVSSGTTYLLYGDVEEDVIKTIAVKSLANPIIQDFHYYRGKSRR
ncbi:MAG: phosphoribosylformylglycinamidine synthase subunit PurS, partial [Candidatus Bathyarchaeia archaeon]